MCLNMKAYVQYNDFLGTAAADISDYTTLEKYLNGINVDTNRYHPIGAKFYTSYGDDFCNVEILCQDREKKNSLAALVIEDMSIQDFFMLFKRFEVVLHLKTINIDDCEVEDRVYVNTDPILEQELLDMGFIESSDKTYTKDITQNTTLTLFKEGDGFIPSINKNGKYIPCSIQRKMKNIKELIEEIELGKI